MFEVFMNRQEEKEIDLPVFKEYAIDFKTNQPIYKDGEIVILEKNEALKVWIYKCLKTYLNESEIHSDLYGTKLIDHIGTVYNELIKKLLIEEQIKQALLVNPYIKNAYNFDFNNTDEGLFVYFDVATIYGEFEFRKEELELGY